jgi:hypothetical protein
MKQLFSKVIKFLAVGAVALTPMLLAPQASAVSYNGGTYTNLCGTGTNATSNTCKAGCDTASGTCKSSTNAVVKYTCAGNQTECRSNESGFSTQQSIGNSVPCNTTVQIDVFSKNCRNSSGAWTCGDTDLKDYIVWYSGACPVVTPAPSSNPTSCSAQMPVNTQFRRSGQSAWVSGADITASGLTQNTQIDVNCFAKNGTALLSNANIEISYPSGINVTSVGPELRNFVLGASGNYSFRCYSSNNTSCNNTDNLSVAFPSTAVGGGQAAANTSSCDDLTIASGNSGLVPAKVTLRARASDDLGNIQRYKFYFGDGTTQETDQPEIQHTYESSGSFIARADVKDSQGNWKTSSRCEARVSVRPSRVESHRAGCSDLYITTKNGVQAPATIGFRVTGYDNKGNLQQYKLDFGNGITKESNGETFEQLYDKAGTYTVKAYVKDSQGNWRGGEGSCKRNVYISTKPLTSQPKTGTPTTITLLAITSGVAAVGFYMAQRRLNFAGNKASKKKKRA